MAKTQWEYEIQNVETGDPVKAQQTMNEMGEEGWEIFVLLPGDTFKGIGLGWRWAIAKRPREATKE